MGHWKPCLLLVLGSLFVYRTSAQCTTGNLRLAGTNRMSELEGRLEVCNSNRWGTICDDAWDFRDSNVACGQLGFSNAGASTIGGGRSTFGAGSGTIWLDDVACTGTENRVIDCQHRPLGQHNCNHNEDVALRCLPLFVCTDGDIRLVGGTSPLEGRVEVCLNNTWGTVCDDLWGTLDAQVVCYQLGFRRNGAVARRAATFGQGTGAIHLDDVQCNGGEQRIIECSTHPLGDHNCDHSRDAGVVCLVPIESCDRGDIRLVGGGNQYEGRVEVCNNNAWGTVCDDAWGAADAQVVCQQLGYTAAGSVGLLRATFGQGVGNVWLDDVQCTGRESSLLDCPARPIGTVSTNCMNHAEDAGVRCTPDTTCSTENQYDLRLVNGTTPLEGRVEMCYNGQWGTMCSDRWYNSVSGVACRQLGFSASGSVPVVDGGFGQGTGPIWLDDLSCSAWENRLFDCRHRAIGQHNCDHGRDAGVRCLPIETLGPNITCNLGDIRLVGGSNPLEGRVEVCAYNQWGTVCDDFWGTNDARVACRQLGYDGSRATAFSGARFGAGDGPIVMDNVQCQTGETRLYDCRNTRNHNCVHSEDAGVRCFISTSGCNTGDIRLAGTGNSSMQGRIEVCNANEWGTVCNDLWQNRDAYVTCRQLGYSTVGASGQRNQFTQLYGQGTGQIWLDQVQCRGNEARLYDCPANNAGRTNCNHNEDAGVTCTTDCFTGDVRLAGGRNFTEGRVEVCSNGTWGTVCIDSWGTQDAQVVCRQLGFQSTNARSVGAVGAGFGQGTGIVMLDEVRCQGSETRIADCYHTGYGSSDCPHSRDAGVRCQFGGCNNGDVILVNGPSANEGRVLFCYNQQWGTVCDELWNTVDAQVVCRQLGYETTGVTAILGSPSYGFGGASQPIWLDQVQCRGTEVRLSDCPASPLGINNCIHQEDAAVQCSIVCNQGDIRLVDGSTNLEGRVEVCNNNVWGTVCDDFWGNLDARVVCTQLGLPSQGAVGLRQAPFGVGTGQIVLDQVRCVGTESTLLSCPSNPLNVHDCSHVEDAGVRCQPITTVCSNGDIRLVDGSSELEGRVEICLNNTWGTVCNRGWQNVDAMVACRQAGHSTIGAVTAPPSMFGQGTGPTLRSMVACTGNEARLSNCRSTFSDIKNCGHSQDTGVICQPLLITPCTQNDLRLVGGDNEMEGRVEICFNNQWGTICDDQWGNFDAFVVCRQLGFSDVGAIALTNAAFGAGTGAIVLDNVQCRATESNLIDCPANDIGINNCDHSEDAGVRCQAATTVCSNGDIRLVGGSTNFEGRVEICNNNDWGTVCDDGWGDNDATVVCRQLGYADTGAIPFSRAQFGQGQFNQAISLDEVGCLGTENRLVDCRHNPIGIHNCTHSNDASVRCSSVGSQCDQGAIRLVGGISEFEGRVEFCNDNEWGTVCDDVWGIPDATVVCRQLGFSDMGAQAIILAYFGPGTGQIFLDQVACSGDEYRLADCQSNPTGVHDCIHIEDAGVRCQGGTTPPPCSNGDLRLVGGNSDLEGRVEVCNNAAWGTVCDDFWGTPDANVVCRQLGYLGTGATALRFAHFGVGTGSIFLDNVRCIGNEQRLVNCPANAIGSHNCNHFEDASVICLPMPTTPTGCTNGDIRLVNGTSNRNGRLEVCYNNAWGTICQNRFFAVDAGVACGQLGFSRFNGSRVLSTVYGQGTGLIVLDQVQCIGSESRLFDCPASPFGMSTCDHSMDIGISCAVVCNNGDIRIVDGDNPREGRVEICNNQAWGTVCDDFWDTTDAGIVCVQLGYHQEGAVPVGGAFFGQGTGNILLDNLHCEGTESRLVDCPHNGIAVDNCFHWEDAGVRCTGACTDRDIRLVGGSSQYEGRVEVCNLGVWGTVCDDVFGAVDARVVCRQLGYLDQGAVARTRAYFGQGSGSIILDQLRCLGTETNVFDCPANPTEVHNCNHREDAGVTCQPITTTAPPPCTEWDIRLVGGSSDLNGRVEVCFSGVWGTVCDDFWDNNAAAVVCSQLGYAREGSIAHNLAAFGQGTGRPIVLDDVRCVGNESQIRNCSYTRTHNCVHLEDAGVTCAVCAEGAIRLVGGTVAYEGRVEVCDQGGWSTVCDDAWGTIDARVACRQAGYSRFNSIAYGSARFGQGFGPILLDNVACTGVETRLIDCNHNGEGVHNCLHSEDASVRCVQNLRCNHGSIRLVGGLTPNEGRVEVCANETWGTVCDGFWGPADATVVCVQLGYSRYNATALGRAFFGQGTVPILFDDLDCIGTETNILQCPLSTLTGACSHAEDASVQCNTELLCQNGDVRLAGRTSSIYEGRVELCFNEQWGTVCDDFWGDNDATVVCRQLGYITDGAQALSLAYFGQGTGQILLDNVACSGSESRLIECAANQIAAHNCIHLEDASVRCRAPETPCSSGDLRLVGGTVANEGRVEFCQSGTWGTVCDDFWGLADARVVCRQLGYADVNSTAYSQARFGLGTGPIYLDNVQCAGTEERLGDCRANAIGSHNCGHREDAGVGCQVCINGDIRLVNGDNELEGRVEVCVNMAWGTVCDDLWGVPDATVVCRQLGFSDMNAQALSLAFFGQGEDPIVLDNVRCVGTEQRLLDCPYLATHNCIHVEDAAVRCMPRVCDNGDVRLQGGSTAQEGRVEICMNGQWSTVCNEQWDNIDASIVCRQLNNSRFHTVAVTDSRYGAGTGQILFTNVTCNGTENRLIDCASISQHTCTHTMDASVQCRAELLCNDTQVRLVDGASMYEGRVEICFNETWGTICDGSWSVNDANVVCRQLGFAATGAIRYLNAFFGQGTGPIYLDDFICTGRESRLIDCRNGGLNMIDFCNGHADDAGVKCAENCTNNDIRLADGTSANEGRVELCVNGQWGTVCDDFWGTVDAQVVCRQLNFTTAGAQALSFAFFGQGTGPIVRDNVQCTGSEQRLIDCTALTIHNCVHAEDAGVRCQGCATGELRLVGGASTSEGRVEICQNAVWGTVCDDSWEALDATVVCRQLGFSAIGSVARSRAFFGQGTGMIFLDDVACTGSETRLSDCTATTQHNCQHSEDAGVTCIPTPVCETGRVRIVGGISQFEGRVEVCINETWGTVCDDAWDATDAGIVCNQLGFSRFNVTAIQTATTFGEGTGPIHIDNTACTGNEQRLLDCPYDTHTQDCTHAEDSGVRCSGRLVCEDGELRLAGGTNDLEGRLEICFNEMWGTICDGFWSTFDAIVACRQLGFRPSGAVPLYNAFFGPGTGPVWLDDLLCNSREDRIADCPNGGVGNIDFCNGHNDDAGVRCQEGCTNNELRLVGGTVPNEGRVEVCLDQQFGTVCDDFWDPVDATVVCRQLGFSTINAIAFVRARFGAGTGPIYLDNVACIGTEGQITSCTYDSVTTDCAHSQDAGVFCVPDLVCNNGDVRLVGGTVMTEGRVEICINETWGTVCDDQWDFNDAGVACRSVGLSRFGATALRQAFFGAGNGTIFLDELGCTGSETSLLDCTNTMQHDCTHSEDAGVRCTGPPTCLDGDIRLVAGPVPSSGRVELCRNEAWGTVCDDLWTQTDANVVCRQLGYSRYGAMARTNAFFGQGSGAINLDDSACFGNESRLIDCPFSTTHNCAHSEDAGVECVVTRVCQEGDVRLQGDTSELVGRVEVCVNETWSTICDNGWTINDANVVCGQLGFLELGATVYSNARYGSGTGPIALSNVACTGTETSILDCPAGNVPASCTHSDDAALMCQRACTPGDIRLVGGTTIYQGRVEICVDRIWGTVCDDFWGTADAAVACRQLGFSEHNATAVLFAGFGRGTGPIHIDDVNCQGFEDALINCTYDSNTADCQHFEDAGVRCQPCSNGEVRLEGGSTAYQGRVEVCRNQIWGTVCDNQWSNIDAQVTCRHLGYSGFGAQAFSNAFFGQGSGSIYLDNVQCDGTEVDLFACTATTSPTCGHANDAGVQCSPTPICIENSLRLLDGPNVAAGRVEVCVLETWRTICDNQWGPEDASVVCKQLGYSRHNASVSARGAYPAGSGPIWATSVTCTGEEDQLTDCNSATATSCTHTMDAGVMCNQTVLCGNGDLRIVNGPSELEGRLEICWNETWGTICDGGWSTFDANVACRQLGYAPSGTPRYNAAYGQGTGPVLLDDLFCSGSERRLIDCVSGGIGMIDFCNGHADDAGIVCQETCDNGAIRFVNGQTLWEGRVEVCKDQVWGTVCDDFWSNEDAGVACRQAGYSGFNGSALPRTAFGAGTGPIHLDDLMCTGNEATLFDCPFDPTHNCIHLEDAGVRCNPIRVCNESDVRLVDGSNEMEGRVEICIGETWGTVCDNLWTSQDANVVCNQLGYSKVGATAYRGAQFGQGTGPIHLGDLQCTGSEMNLINCTNGGIGTYTGRCTHAMDSGATCLPKVCNDGDIRLVGGTNMLEGRVEICFNEAWGTICDNNFDGVDGSVICGQLGFSRRDVQALAGAVFGQGTGVPQLDSLQCFGNETTLADCPSDSSNAAICPHSKDASVRCQVRTTFPNNVQVAVRSNTSMNVSWTQPSEFYSDIIKYRVTCNSTDQRSNFTLQTDDRTQFFRVFNNLVPYTNYTCCVETLYTDLSENALACAPTTLTPEGIPGLPTNVRVTTSTDDCTQVDLNWDPPPIENRYGVIRQYRIVAASTVDIGFNQNFIANTNSYTLTGLQCCTDYSYTVSAFTIEYGPISAATPFRTLADLSTPVTVSSQAQDSTTLIISWNVHQNVVDQDVTQYQLVVASNCFNEDLITPPQLFVRGPDDAPTITVTGLVEYVPYLVRLSAVICQSSVQVYNAVVFTREPVASSPMITAVSRLGSTTGLVQFTAPPGDESPDYFDIAYYSDNFGTYSEDRLVDSIRTSDLSRQLDNFDACTAYWITVTAVSCGSQKSSAPSVIDIYNPTAFTFVITLGNTGSCKVWNITNTLNKLMDVYNQLQNVARNSTGNACIASGRWTCSAEDDSVATYTVSLGSFDESISGFRETQFKTLNDWLEPLTEITIDGSVYKIVKGDVPPPTQISQTGGGVPGYGWALIVLAVVAIALVVVFIAAIIFVRRRPKDSNVPSERMQEDTFDSRSAHSIGIVENPLYSEESDMGMPSFAKLSAKEKADEAQFDYEPGPDKLDLGGF